MRPRRRPSPSASSPSACGRALVDAGVREGVSVGTVDGAQGAESDTVILSFVRSNANASIGFVEDWRRLNVAITRAKRALIMVGNARTIGAADVGDAPGDLVRRPAQTRAIYTCPSGYTSAEAAARADASADADAVRFSDIAGRAFVMLQTPCIFLTSFSSFCIRWTSASC